MPFDNEGASEIITTDDRCEQCGAIKLGKTVKRPIHDGPWPRSGRGRMERELVIWCPSCEVEPVSPGPPITNPDGWLTRLI